jgi:hypothetical protein
MSSSKPKRRLTDRRVDFIAIADGVKIVLQVLLLAMSLLKHWAGYVTESVYGLTL